MGEWGRGQAAVVNGRVDDEDEDVSAGSPRPWSRSHAVAPEEASEAEDEGDRAMRTTCCDGVRADTGRLPDQARRDLTYGAIVILCFVLGVGAAVGALALAQPVLVALLQLG